MSDLRCTGCGRDANNSLAFYFNRRPTDDEMRFIHECIRRAACLAEAPEPDAAQAKLRLVPLEVQANKADANAERAKEFASGGFVKPGIAYLVGERTSDQTVSPERFAEMQKAAGLAGVKPSPPQSVTINSPSDGDHYTRPRNVALDQGYGGVERLQRQAEADIKREASKPFTMRILASHDKVTWNPTDADRWRALANHYQSLERLNELGGLSWCELAAVVENRPFRSMNTDAAKAAVRDALSGMRK